MVLTPLYISDLGWDQWIIYPDSFTFVQCSVCVSQQNQRMFNCRDDDPPALDPPSQVSSVPNHQKRHNYSKWPNTEFLLRGVESQESKNTRLLWTFCLSGKIFSMWSECWRKCVLQKSMIFFFVRWLYFSARWGKNSIKKKKSLNIDG